MNKKSRELKILIIGCGSIGERHLHNLNYLGMKKIAILDVNKKRVLELSSKYDVQKFYDLNSALAFEPDATLICTHPYSHASIAKACIEVNSHLFIEKPISINEKEIEKILQRAKIKNLIIAVGYNNRFEKGLQAIKKKITKSEIGQIHAISVQFGNNIKFWKPGTNFRNHYILKKGGGIILDDSHEYDYVRWILNDEVHSVYAQTLKMTSVKTETESIASFILKFKRGTIASFMLDYVRPKYERNCQIIGEKGDIKWEYQPQKKSWNNYNSSSFSKVTTNYLNKKPEMKKFQSKSNNMYIEEIENFLNSIITNTKPFVDGWEGLKTLQLGTAILKSAKDNKVILL